MAWAQPASDGGAAISGYRVQWKSGAEEYDGSDSSTRQALLSDPAADGAHRIEGLAVGTAYTVRVLAVNAAGDGAAAEASATAQDRLAPALTDAAVDGTLLTLTFDEALDQDSTPAADAFAVTVDDAAHGVDHLTLAGSAVELTLAAAVAAGRTVTVGYTVPTAADAAPLRDAAGNAAAAFSGHSGPTTGPRPATRRRAACR